LRLYTGRSPDQARKVLLLALGKRFPRKPCTKSTIKSVADYRLHLIPNPNRGTGNSIEHEVHIVGVVTASDELLQPISVVGIEGLQGGSVDIIGIGHGDSPRKKGTMQGSRCG
jgi:hypothetical protein